MRSAPPPIWLSPRGAWTILGFAAALALAGAVPALQPVVVVAALVVAALIVVDVALGPPKHALRIQRRPVDPLALRRASVATYDLENRSSVAVRIGLFESPVPILQFDPDGIVVDIPGRARVTRTIAIAPRERGLARFGDLYAWSSNRIGLLRRRYRIAAACDVRVLSNLDALAERGSLARRSTLLEAGLRKLRLRGLGTEFESLREYQPGDPFRHVDWKASARGGRLMVAQFEPERSQNVVVMLDCGRLMTPRIGTQRKFEYALEAGLAVARVAAEAGDNVGFEAFAAAPLLSLPARRGVAAASALVRATYQLHARMEEPDYETVFAQFRRRYGKRTLVILFTDIFDPVTSQAVLAALSSLAPRHLAMCVLMNDAAIETALATEPRTEAGAYRTAVAMTLSDERAKAIAVLRSRGALVVDVAAPRLTLALLDAYLDVKARALL